MMNTTNTADALTFTVPLSFEAYSLAQMCSKHKIVQIDPSKYT